MATQQNRQHSQPTDSLLIPKIPSQAVPDRRAHPRHAVDCPVRISLLLGEKEALGRITNLSLGGCLVTSEKRLGIGVQVRVEVAFQLRGIAFRLAGVTVSNRNRQAFAVRFLDVPSSRRQELAAALAEEADRDAARQAAEIQKADSSASNAPATPGPIPVPAAPPPRPAQLLVEACAAIVGAPPAPTPARDRRTSRRQAVDTRANLLLVKTGITMSGRILNLSLGGCRIRTEERFDVGIYVRVEAEFYLHGLPFRVGGVSQAILDKHTIGVRFLDLSARRREQLSELMEEIGGATAEGRDPAAADKPAASE